MSLKRRLNRLEREFGRLDDCPVRRNGTLSETDEVLYGQESPPATPCPQCGRPRGQVAIVLFRR